MIVIEPAGEAEEELGADGDPKFTFPPPPAEVALKNVIESGPPKLVELVTAANGAMESDDDDESDAAARSMFTRLFLPPIEIEAELLKVVELIVMVL